MLCPSRWHAPPAVGCRDRFPCRRSLWEARGRRAGQRHGPHLLAPPGHPAPRHGRPARAPRRHPHPGHAPRVLLAPQRHLEQQARPRRRVLPPDLQQLAAQARHPAARLGRRAPARQGPPRTRRRPEAVPARSLGRRRLATRTAPRGRVRRRRRPRAPVARRRARPPPRTRVTPSSSQPTAALQGFIASRAWGPPRTPRTASPRPHRRHRAAAPPMRRGPRVPRPRRRPCRSNNSNSSKRRRPLPRSRPPLLRPRLRPPRRRSLRRAGLSQALPT